MQKEGNESEKMKGRMDYVVRTGKIR